MIDIRLIREKPEEVKQAIKSLNDEAPIDDIVSQDSRRRTILQELEKFRHQRNVTSKEIGGMKDDIKRQELIDEMAARAPNDAMKDRLKSLREHGFEFDKIQENLAKAGAGKFTRTDSEVK